MDCEHTWTYKGLISENSTIWEKNCVKCKTKYECNHAWNFTGTFREPNWKKSCAKCGIIEDIEMTNAVKETFAIEN